MKYLFCNSRIPIQNITKTGAVFTISVELANEVKDRDQFQIDISKAKHIPPRKIKRNISYLRVKSLGSNLSSYFIQIYKKGNASKAL